MRAKDIMTAPVVTVTAETTVKHAAELLAAHGFTALPVLDEDEALIGVVTEADLVRDRFPRDPRYRHRAAQRRECPPETVGELMTIPAVAVGGGADIADVVTVMLDSRLRSLPVVDGSRVIGILTRQDLVRVLSRADTAIAADVRHRLAEFAGPDRWTVSVHDGAVDIVDEFDDRADRRADRHVATVLAESVPGVTEVHTSSSQPSEMESNEK